MSSFKENFERGDREQLDYDDSAFYYFSMVLLLFIVMPATWYIVVKPMMNGMSGINYSLKNCACSICTARFKKREALYAYTWMNTAFGVKILVLLYLWYLTWVCYDVIKDVEPLKTFIPNEILGVAMDASKGEVKKAYRKISREKHPDKNPDNPEAVNEFI